MGRPKSGYWIAVRSVVGLLVLTLVAMVTGCAPQSPDHSSWVDQADTALSDVASQVATVTLLLELAQDGKVFGKTQQVIAQDSETAVGETAARFSGEQPTPEDDAAYAAVTGVMSDASDLLADVRIAVVRRDTAAYPGLLDDLGAVQEDVTAVQESLR